MSERELADALARLAGPVVPGEDPYGRLMRRHRRSRRTTAAGWSTAVVAVVVAALFGPIGIQGAATPVLGGPSGSASGRVPDPGEVITPAVRQLIDSPPRGGLAGDGAFLQRLTSLLQARHIEAVPNGRVKILFAGDVGDARLVIAARYDDTRQTGLIVYDRAGSSPEELATTATEQHQDGSMVFVTALEPFFRATVTGTTAGWGRYGSVGLAPAGCVIATADITTTPLTWRDEATGDYAVSAGTMAWQRVTCDGILRYQGPTGGSGIRRIAGDRYTEAQITAAISGARGEVDRSAVTTVLQRACTGDVTEVPTLLFSGRPPGTEYPTQSLVIAPVVGGWWCVHQESPELGGMTFRTPVDLGAPGTVVAATLAWPASVTPGQSPAATAEPRPRLLVVAPPGSVTLQVRDARGVVVDTKPLADGIGVVTYTEGAQLTLWALDADGKKIGTGVVPLPTESTFFEDVPYIDWQ